MSRATLSWLCPKPCIFTCVRSHPGFAQPDPCPHPDLRWFLLGGFPRGRGRAHEAPRTPGIHQPAAAVAFGVLVLKESHNLAPQQCQVQSPSPADVACHLVQLFGAIPAQESLHLTFSPWKEWLGGGWGGTKRDTGA